MNISLGLMRLWFAAALLWDVLVAGGLYALWPVDPNPPPLGFVVDGAEGEKLKLLVDGAAVCLIGDGSLLLIALAGAWAGGSRRRNGKFPDVQ